MKHHLVKRARRVQDMSDGKMIPACDLQVGNRFFYSGRDAFGGWLGPTTHEVLKVDDSLPTLLTLETVVGGFATTLNLPPLMLVQLM